MNAEHKKQLYIGGGLTLLFCLGGAALIVLGFLKYTDSKSFAATAKATEGEVVGFEKYDAPGSSIRDDIYYALVLYKTDSGQKIRFRGPSRDGPVKLRKGDQVRVLYRPEDPENARVDSFMGLWFAAAMLWAVGGGAVLIPLLTLWQAWKWVKRQELPGQIHAFSNHPGEDRRKAPG